MNTRHTWIFGLAALGLALAAPAQAMHGNQDGTFMVAKRDAGDDTQQGRRNEQPDSRTTRKRTTERDEPQGYGYGYERRQQGQPSQDSSEGKGSPSRQPRR